MKPRFPPLPIIGAVGFDGGFKPAISLVFPPKRPPELLPIPTYCGGAGEVPPDLLVTISGVSTISGCDSGFIETALVGVNGVHILRFLDSWSKVLPGAYHYSSLGSGAGCPPGDPQTPLDLEIFFTCREENNVSTPPRPGHLWLGVGSGFSGPYVFATSDPRGFIFFNFGDVAPNDVTGRGGIVTVEMIG